MNELKIEDLSCKRGDSKVLNNINLTIKWMPSHKKEGEELPQGITETDRQGNKLADVEADKAAKRASLPVNVTSTVIYYKSLVKRIQKRLKHLRQCQNH